jgi:hypothetical protein
MVWFPMFDILGSIADHEVNCKKFTIAHNLHMVLHRIRGNRLKRYTTRLLRKDPEFQRILMDECVKLHTDFKVEHVLLPHFYKLACKKMLRYTTFLRFAKRFIDSYNVLKEDIAYFEGRFSQWDRAMEASAKYIMEVFKDIKRKLKKDCIYLEDAEKENISPETYAEINNRIYNSRNTLKELKESVKKCSNERKQVLGFVKLCRLQYFDNKKDE